jgi:hypothetical protein
MKQEQPPGSAVEPFGGYGLAIARICWVNGLNLSVRRHWSEEIRGRPSPRELHTCVDGDGVLEIDTVSVIGSNARAKEFHLGLWTDKNVAEEWAYAKANRQALIPHGASTPEQRVRKRIFELLDDKAPTATLFPMEDDRERGGINGGWAMEVKLPSHVMRQLEEDLVANRTQRVNFGIEWVCGLVFDEHAPPNFPTDWGLFRVTEKASPEPLRGHVVSIGWTLGEPMRSNEPAKSNFKKERDAFNRHEHQKSLTQQIDALRSAIMIGFVAITALMLMSYFLR